MAEPTGLFHEYVTAVVAGFTAVGAAIVGIFARIFAAGSRMANIQAELQELREAIEDLKAWREELRREHVQLQIQVGSLPTRQEQQAQFDRLMDLVRSYHPPYKGD